MLTFSFGVVFPWFFTKIGLAACIVLQVEFKVKEMEVSVSDYYQDFFLIQCQEPVFITRFFDSKCAGPTWRLLLELFETIWKDMFLNLS